MARPEKVTEVRIIAQKLQAAQCLVLADFTGLTVEHMTAFRAICRSRGVECRVVKNRLAKIAATEVDLEVLLDHLSGPTAMILGPESQIEPAKVVVEFAKDHQALQVKGAIVEGRYLDIGQVVALSQIPSREELLAKMMGSIQSPLTGLAMVTNGVIAALTRALDGVAKQKAA